MQAFRRAKLATGGLYPVASLAVVAIAFGTADVLHGSGFLAVYLAGLAMGSAQLPARQTVHAFHDGLAWVAQLAMFLTLGLLVFPHQLGRSRWQGTLIALVLVFVARPLAVTVATAFAPLRLRRPDRARLGGPARRGAGRARDVPGHRGRPRQRQVLQHRVLRRARLDARAGLDVRAAGAGGSGRRRRSRRCRSPLVEVGTIRQLGADVVEVADREGDAAIGVRVRDLGLPREALVNVLVRGDEALPPRGSTRLEAGDRLYIVARQVAMARDRGGAPALAQRARSARRRARRARSRDRRADLHDAAVDARPTATRTRPSACSASTVVERLDTRWDVPGALVVLADGRYAVSGPHVLVGSREQLQWHARRRAAARRATDAERAWWQEVIGASAL